jgi:hypothetical protein
VPVRIVAGCILAGIVVLYAPRVEAQDLSIAIADERVTMVARDVPLQNVLSELARIGGVTVSGADRIGASPVTLALNAVDGRAAFEILLRNAGGYVMIARQAAAPGALPIERVLILPENVAWERLAQSQPDPEGALQQQGVQNNSERADAVEPSPSSVEVPTSPAIPKSPTPSPFSARPTFLAPDDSPDRAVPTFAVPIGFSGRPGDRVTPPPPSPEGIDTRTGLPPPLSGTVLGAKPK